MIFLNGDLVKVKQFPNGETLIATENLIVKRVNDIELRFENDMDLMNLIFIKKHIDDKGCVTDLLIPYMPYSRMDRTEGLTLFTLKYVCSIINDLKFESVTIYEPHSDVCTALLDRVAVVNVSAMLAQELLRKLNYKATEDDKVYLFYPDAGAMKRYGKQIKYDKVLTANKERDFASGRITKLNIEGAIPQKPFDVVIVDDLCSKGGTFMLSAQKLKEIGANNIYLVVAHCENTIAEGEILNTDLITEVYTTNSILTVEHDKIRKVTI